QEGKCASLNKALIDYFRCPEVFADFLLRGDLCPGEGYFHFGPELIGYGQSSLGYNSEKPEKATCDLVYHTRTEGTTCYIPFDLSAIVENLRCELYLGHSGNGGREKEQTSAVRKAYYLLRPHLTVP